MWLRNDTNPLLLAVLLLPLLERLLVMNNSMFVLLLCLATRKRIEPKLIDLWSSFSWPRANFAFDSRDVLCSKPKTMDPSDGLTAINQGGKQFF